MARTQAADYGRRREAIVDRAARLFAERGFRGTSVADLAKACEASKSLIYHYYPSKEDILYAVMASHIEQLEQDVADALATGRSDDERLRLLVHAFMGHYAGAADRHKVLLNGLDDLPAPQRRTIVDKQRGIVAAVSGLLGSIGHDGDAARLRARAMLLFGMINWTHTWYDPGGALSPAAIADLALAMAGVTVG